MSKRGLGKGLNALIRKNESTSEPESGIIEINHSDIIRNQNQPRQEFNEEKLEELAASIKEHGVIQPIIVRQTEDKYEIIAGERRWRAAKIAGVKKLPAIIKDVSEKELTELALIENIQREDLNSIEEAMAYKQLMEEFGLTQDDLSKRVGKSRPFIANCIRLLNLPKEVRTLVQRGILTSGHARALLVLKKASEQVAVAKKIVDNNLSVRQLEKMVKNFGSEKEDNKKQKKDNETDSPIIKDIQEKFQGKLGTKVRIKHSNKRGIIEIEYYGDDDLQRIIDSFLGEEYN